MNELEELHEQAMDYSESAFVAKRKGDLAEFKRLSISR
jgi:hypothetical protein